MQIYEVEGKDPSELIEKVLKKYNLDENQIIYHTEEHKGSLFKGTTYTLKAVELSSITEFIENYLRTLFAKLKLEVTYDFDIEANQIKVNMNSNNNAILIGRGGQTLNALQNIVRQVIITEIDMLPVITLDVENYKNKRIENLERLARNIAKEVIETGITATLDNMNSYERRIVHNALASVKEVSTYSEGTEPNRHVVIEKN